MNANALLTGIGVGWAVVLLSCLVAMMAIFMGSSSGDLAGLLRAQAVALPLALLAIGGYLWRAARLAGGSGGAALLWRHTPGWLLFVIASAASLTLIAELTFGLVQALAGEPRPWPEHVPAILALVSSVALAMAWAERQASRQL